jgi:RimJ/RimL family protein N-acetyltransferase
MAGFSPILLPIPDALYGPRIVVRQYRSTDAAAVFEGIDESRNHLPPFEPWPQFYQSVEDVLVYVTRAGARWALREELPGGIFDRQTGRFLGAAGIHRLDWERRIFEIGYWVRASEQGHGYITEAVKLLSALAFRQLGALRVEVRMDERNRRSWAVPVRLGFRLEAKLRNASPAIDGVPGVELIYGMTDADFAAADWA